VGKDELFGCKYRIYISDWLLHTKNVRLSNI